MENRPPTEELFDDLTARCREIFRRKAFDYGASWRIFRPASLTDQIFIKAKRIRSIEEKGKQMVADSIESEYMGIINYSYMALMMLSDPLPESEMLSTLNPDIDGLTSEYDRQTEVVKELLQAKNHDYGEAWRDMRISSCTDMILSKILRIKQIEDHHGQLLVSEKLEQNYYDIINYAFFAWVKLNENNE